jgi:protein-S-isoprenylcysteine O-methyltransferase Ste14
MWPDAPHLAVVGRSATEVSAVKRTAFLLYGSICYGVFFVTFLYAVGFLANRVVPKSIDSGTEGPVAAAVLINALLLGLFALQHSVMARPGFKQGWFRWMPRPIERSTYVLLTSLLLLLLFWQWRPLPGIVWEIGDPLLHSAVLGLFVVGVLTVLYATFLIDHFDLFGMRQVYLYWRGRPYTHPDFATPSLYRFIRHPLYVGWFLTFWSTPQMTWGHLLFALLASGYILAAIPLEERDLERFLGDEYRRYRARTPMFLPLSRRRKPEVAVAPGDSR